MRILSLFFLLLIFASCDHPRKPYIEELRWPKRTIKLDNDLGTLTIRLPNEFDTFYYFDKVYDYGCDKKVFRFQRKQFPALDEFWHNLKLVRADSLYHFSVIHILGKDCVPVEQIDINYLKKSADYYTLHERIINNDSIHWQIQKIQNINGIKYVILADSSERSKLLRKEVLPLKKPNSNC
jgi:hypothetical protein